MHNRIIALEGELSEARQRIAEAINAKAESNTADSEELEKANSMIAALKKQRQELISQTATLRSQNKSYENQIASTVAEEHTVDDCKLYYKVVSVDKYGNVGK